MNLNFFAFIFMLWYSEAIVGSGKSLRIVKPDLPVVSNAEFYAHVAEVKADAAAADEPTFRVSGLPNISNPEDFPKDDPITRAGLFEGDMLMTEDEVIQEYGKQIAKMAKQHGELLNISDGKSERLLGAATKSRRWTNNQLFWKISNDFDEGKTDKIRGFIKDFSRKLANVDLIEGRGYGNFVDIRKEDGCFSKVGMKGGAQVMSLGPNCVKGGVVEHEFLHALGFKHEQSAPNRDDFIEVKFDNIRPGFEHNFVKLSNSELNEIGNTYDYGSVMHYGTREFGKPILGGISHKKTISCNGNDCGQRKGVSVADIEDLNALYAVPQGFDRWHDLCCIDPDLSEILLSSSQQSEVNCAPSCRDDPLCAGFNYDADRRICSFFSNATCMYKIKDVKEALDNGEELPSYSDRCVVPGHGFYLKNFFAMPQTERVQFCNDAGGFTDNTNSVCCPASCTVCGGSGCDVAPNEISKCCTRRILKNQSNRRSPTTTSSTQLPFALINTDGLFDNEKLCESRDGIMNFEAFLPSEADACCPKKCGKCGGPTCAGRPGGTDKCCRGSVVKKNHCGSVKKAPCTLTPRPVV